MSKILQANWWRKKFTKRRDRTPSLPSLEVDPLKQQSINDTKLSDLPPDILVDILIRLPVTALCCLRCVSKTFKIIINDPSFMALHTRSSAGNEDPQLVLVDSCFSSLALQSIEYKDKAFQKSKHAETVIHRDTETALNDLDDFFLHFVFCNLFCFRVSNQGPCFLVDPLKGQVLKLPTSNIIHVPSHSYYANYSYGICDWYGMGFDDITNTYKIVRVTNRAPYCRLDMVDMVAQVLVLGTSSWRKIGSVPPCCLSTTDQVSTYGDMHWLINDSLSLSGTEEGNRIISFDFKKEEFYWTPHPIEPILKMHLLNLRGCLALVIIDADILGRIIMKLKIWLCTDKEVHNDCFEVPQTVPLKNHKKKKWTLYRDITVPTITLPYSPWEAFRFRLATSFGEWKHGIYLQDINSSVHFYDRDFVASIVKCPPVTRSNAPHTWKLISCTRSLISLKDYGDLVEAEEASNASSKSGVCQGHYNLSKCQNLLKKTSPLILSKEQNWTRDLTEASAWRNSYLRS